MKSPVTQKKKRKGPEPKKQPWPSEKKTQDFGSFRGGLVPK